MSAPFPRRRRKYLNRRRPHLHFLLTKHIFFTALFFMFGRFYIFVHVAAIPAPNDYLGLVSAPTDITLIKP